MGSKLVKAVRAGGGFETSVFDRERLKRPSEAMRERARITDIYPREGTAGNLSASNKKGVLPTRNFTLGSFDNYLKISGEALRAQIKRKAKGCPGCPIACTGEVKLATRSGTIRVKSPSYQPLVMLGSNLLVDDLESIIRNNYLCFLLGMDPISLGGTIALSMELSEKGRIDLPLHFGSAREIGPLLPLIAQRKGPGDELADGAQSLILKYGYRDLAMVVKGLELSGYDPRGCWGQGLAYATSPAGGTHVGSMLAAPEIQGRPVSLPGASSAGKVRMTVFAQDLFNSLGCTVACFRAAYSLVTVPPWVESLPGVVTNFFAGRAPALAVSFVNFFDYYRAISFVTGVRYDRRAFLRTGERVHNLERLFNLREGFTSKDDNLPLRFIGEPMREGPTAGKVVPITKMLLKYYRLRGWNEVGIPTVQQLEMLGVEERP
jgi:aldehyde:ferredoxin oxidoreductase